MPTCRFCSMVFDSKDSGRRLFCSETCLRKWHNQKRTAEYRTLHSHAGTCPMCGKEFAKKRESQVYCSHACQVMHSELARRAPLKRVVCRYCGKTFVSRYAKRQLCDSCQKYRGRGENRVSPVKRKSIVEQQGGKCWLCRGALDFRVAKVHHLDASGHRAEPNNELDNLVALHERCHTMFHRVHLVYRDGVWGVDGRIFDYVKPESLVVMKTDRDQGS